MSILPEPYESIRQEAGVPPAVVVAGLLGVWLVPGLLVTGCEAPERAGTAWSGSIDTLPDGVVRVQNPVEGAWTEDAAWSATPALRIGSAASGGPDQFGRIGDIVADHEGRIYVLDALAREVRVFAPDGTWIRTMGRVKSIDSPESTSRATRSG